MARSIIHVNIPHFAVAVASALEPRLRDRPVAVADPGAARPVVLDMSEQARRAGVVRGMALHGARRRCRDLVVTLPRPQVCRRAEVALLRHAGGLSPLVEGAGPGHVFLDLSGTGRLLGRAIDVAERFRRSLADDFRMPGTVGLASNRLVSKVATRVVKPAGLCSVTGGCEQAFLAPLPLVLLPGVEPWLFEQLTEFNIGLIGELQKFSAALLTRAVGEAAGGLLESARGIDTTPVREADAAAPVVRERAELAERTNEDAVVAEETRNATGRAAASVRRMGMAARDLRLVLEYGDGKKREVRTGLAVPLSGDFSLCRRMDDLLACAFDRRVRVAAVEVTLAGLTFPFGQMDLFNDTAREEPLMCALDRIRQRYGGSSIRFGRQASSPAIRRGRRPACPEEGWSGSMNRPASRSRGPRNPSCP